MFYKFLKSNFYKVETDPDRSTCSPERPEYNSDHFEQPGSFKYDSNGPNEYFSSEEFTKRSRNNNQQYHNQYAYENQHFNYQSSYPRGRRRSERNQKSYEWRQRREFQQQELRKRQKEQAAERLRQQRQRGTFNNENYHKRTRNQFTDWAEYELYHKQKNKKRSEFRNGHFQTYYSSSKNTHCNDYYSKEGTPQSEESGTHHQFSYTSGNNFEEEIIDLTEDDTEFDFENIEVHDYTEPSSCEEQNYEAQQQNDAQEWNTQWNTNENTKSEQPKHVIDLEFSNSNSFCEELIFGWADQKLNQEISNSYEDNLMNIGNDLNTKQDIISSTESQILDHITIGECDHNITESKNTENVNSTVEIERESSTNEEKQHFAYGRSASNIVDVDKPPENTSPIHDIGDRETFDLHSKDLNLSIVNNDFDENIIQKSKPFNSEAENIVNVDNLINLDSENNTNVYESKIYFSANESESIIKPNESTINNNESKSTTHSNETGSNTKNNVNDSNVDFNKSIYNTFQITETTDSLFLNRKSKECDNLKPADSRCLNAAKKLKTKKLGVNHLPVQSKLEVKTQKPRKIIVTKSKLNKSIPKSKMTSKTIFVDPYADNFSPNLLEKLFDYNF